MLKTLGGAVFMMRHRLNRASELADTRKAKTKIILKLTQVSNFVTKLLYRMALKGHGGTILHLSEEACRGMLPALVLIGRVKPSSDGKPDRFKPEQRPKVS